MTARTGQQYLAGLKDDREVWLASGRVNVLEAPEFQGSLQGVAGYFDWQHTHASDCLTEDVETGEAMPASLIVPRTQEDLARRRRCFERVARYSCGMMGRTPDYLNATLAGFVARSDVLDAGADPQASARLRAFYREVVRGDLALTHTIVQPVVDKEVSDVAGQNGELAARVVGRTRTGIIVRGAKVLATLGPFADELFVYPGGTTLTQESRQYALMFSIPVSTPGLVQVCRDHYGSRGEVRDHPFSSRFDEQDAFVIFNDVEVPHERVFIDGDVETYNTIWRQGWSANITQQTTVRAAVKLEFAYELGSRMAHILNAQKRPDVACALGELLQYGRLARAAAVASEANARIWGDGALFPDEEYTRAIRTMMPTWMIRANEILITLGSHNLLATPSMALFDNPQIGPLLRRYLPGAGEVPATERAQVFRMAWDFVGSALGSRAALYERFYLGSQARAFLGDFMAAERTPTDGGLADFLERSR